MMKLIKTVLYAVVFTLISCNSTESEVLKMQELEQARIDSLKLDKIHRERIGLGQSKKRELLTNKLKKVSIDLEMAYKELDNINQWQLGRLRSEKKSQLAGQREKINELSLQVSSLKNELEEVNVCKSFEFQSSPEELVTHVVKVAKNKDLNNMKYLIDPYGEFGPTALEICYVESLSKLEKQLWREKFSNGRLVGNADYDRTKERVSLELAVGVNSDRLIKVELVKRLNSWYFI